LDYSDELNEIGLLVETMSLADDEYLLEEGDSKTFRNHTLQLIDVLENRVNVEVEFNQTTESEEVKEGRVNGLNIEVKECFENKAILRIT
jgi:ATP-dependent 26S proteasome regulatory subunit